MRIIYSRHYNIGFYGFERLHPFDSRKYGRAWKVLRRHFGAEMRDLQVRVDRQANRDELLLVHTAEYLQKLRDSKYVANALEVPQARLLPAWVLDLHILRPMRWATRGTMLAANEALEHGLVINLSGGYHHAKPERGEGFCIYADVGIAVPSLRKQGAIADSARILHIDTDAHQGNGICHTFMNDRSVFIFDLFNANIYPMFDVEARDRIDCPVPISGFHTDHEYMRDLTDHLPAFLDSVCRSPVSLAFYNAGTDILAGDPIGGLQISAGTIRERDVFVVKELRRRSIPTVMLPSGGYTKQSYQLIADSIAALAEVE